MTPQKSQDSRGRPPTGIAPKEQTIQFRIEPWLYEELTYTCRMVGVSRAEAIRQGIKIWITQVRKTHY